MSPSHAQAACTPKELKELVTFPTVAVHAPSEQMAVSPEDTAQMKAVRMRRRMYDLITQVGWWSSGRGGGLQVRMQLCICSARAAPGKTCLLQC